MPGDTRTEMEAIRTPTVFDDPAICQFGDRVQVLVETDQPVEHLIGHRMRAPGRRHGRVQGSRVSAQHHDQR